MPFTLRQIAKHFLRISYQDSLLLNSCLLYSILLHFISLLHIYILSEGSRTGLTSKELKLPDDKEAVLAPQEKRTLNRAFVIDLMTGGRDVTTRGADMLLSVSPLSPMLCSIASVTNYTDAAVTVKGKGHFDNTDNYRIPSMWGRRKSYNPMKIDILSVHCLNSRTSPRH